MWVACLETTLFVVGGVSAWYILKNRHVDFFLKSFKMALLAALMVTPLQIWLGDASGRSVAEYQPTKLAAIEAHWETNPPGQGAPWKLLAWPNFAKQKNDWTFLEIPSGLSLLITRSLTGQVKGLKDFPREDQPPMSLPFYSFRIMLGIGFAMFGLMLWTLWAWYKKRLTAARILPNEVAAVRLDRLRPAGLSGGGDGLGHPGSGPAALDHLWLAAHQTAPRFCRPAPWPPPSASMSPSTRCCSGLPALRPAPPQCGPNLEERPPVANPAEGARKGAWPPPAGGYLVLAHRLCPHSHVVLDGFDLGAGILFLWTRDEGRRSYRGRPWDIPGTPIKPGWWSWADCSSAPFPWPTGWRFRPCTFPSASCCWD